jgi:tRNA-splicing endonuclease subunit Sen34
VIRLINELEAYRTPTYDERINYEDMQIKAEQLRDEAVNKRRKAMAAEYNTYSMTSPIDREYRSDVNTVSASYMVHIPTATPNVPWHQEKLKMNAYDTLVDARCAGVWSFPATAAEWYSFHVYRDLWRRGWWLGSGLKFGGHYLVYPGEYTLID